MTQFRSIIQPEIPIVVGPTSSMSVVYGFTHENVHLLSCVYGLDVTGLAVSWFRVKP